MKKLCLLLSVLLALSLCACRAEESDDEDNAPLTAEQALEEALEALTAGNDSAKASMVGGDGTLTVPQNTGIAAILSAYAEYEVEDMKESGDSATATVIITAPDSVTLLKQVMEGCDDPAQEAFTEELTALLENDPPMLDYTVEVELEQVDGQWGIVPSFELSNALTGGLTAEYKALYEHLLDGLMEGGES